MTTNHSDGGVGARAVGPGGPALELMVDLTGSCAFCLAAYETPRGPDPIGIKVVPG